MMRQGFARIPRGFSLLEILVAFSIMGLALGALYQSLGGSVRGVAEAERQTRAVLTAESLLALYESVPPTGLQKEGTTVDGFAWRIMTEPYPVEMDLSPPWQLHALRAEVRWTDRGVERAFRLATLRPELETDPSPTMPGSVRR